MVRRCRKGGAESGNDLHGLKGLQTSDGAGYGSDCAERSRGDCEQCVAVGKEVGEAAWCVAVVEDGELSGQFTDGRVHPWDAAACANVVDQVAGGEVVGAVHDERVFADDVIGISGR